MLDIVARSQRGRVCEYSRDGNVLETPAMIRSEPEGPVCIAAGEGGRVLRLFGAEVPLESGLLTTASSGMESSSVVKDGVQVVRLPLPEDLVIDDSADVVVVPNAYELRKDPRRIVDVVVRLREAAGFGRLLCMLGIGEPSTVAILSYMGVDLFDDSLPRAAGLERVLLMPEAEVAMGDGDVAGANVDYMEAELAKVRMFIRADRLRELADQRSFSSPSNVALLRLYDQNAYGYAEETCSTVGCRFSCNSTQALRRPDLKRYRDRMRDYRKPEHKRILLLLPCSAKKPYHISKTHRAFASAIHTAQHDTLVHEVIVTSPLGMVPRELDACYPANSYDIPVTGEWKCEERAMIREMVGSLIQQGYDKVICHLGDDYELVEGLAEMECTVVGDPTSPKSQGRRQGDGARGLPRGQEQPGPRPAGVPVRQGHRGHPHGREHLRHRQVPLLEVHKGGPRGQEEKDPARNDDAREGHGLPHPGGCGDPRRGRIRNRRDHGLRAEGQPVRGRRDPRGSSHTHR